MAPRNDTHGFVVFGRSNLRPSSGTVAEIKEKLRPAIATGDRVMLADPDGVYSKAFYNPDPRHGQVIMNLLDPRSPRWDVFGDIRSKRDIPYIAQAFVPASGGRESQINTDARRYFTDVTERLWEAGNLDMQHTGWVNSQYHTVQELYRVLTEEPVGNNGLEALLDGTSSKDLLSSKDFATIRTIASFTLKALQDVNRPEGKSLSLREWAQDTAGEGGIVFMPYASKEIEAFKPMISAWLYFGMQGALSRQGATRRLWVVDGNLGVLADRNPETETTQSPQDVSKRSAPVRKLAVRQVKRQQGAEASPVKRFQNRTAGNKAGASNRRGRNGGFER